MHRSSSIFWFDLVLHHRLKMNVFIGNFGSVKRHKGYLLFDVVSCQGCAVLTNVCPVQASTSSRQGVAEYPYLQYQVPGQYLSYQPAAQISQRVQQQTTATQQRPRAADPFQQQLCVSFCPPGYQGKKKSFSWCKFQKYNFYVCVMLLQRSIIQVIN